MPIKELTPIREKQSFYDSIEKILIDLFKKTIYLPIVKELKHKGLVVNSVSEIEALIRAIFDGTVIVRTKQGKAIFTGDFNSTISKQLKALGATFKKGSAEIPLGKLPIELMQADQRARTKFRETAQKIDKALFGVDVSAVVEKLNLTTPFRKTLAEVDTEFRKNVKSITVAPKLSKEEEIRFAEQYSDSLKLPIVDFMQKQVIDLRSKVRAHVEVRGRAKELAKIIQESYGVSQRKAKFLANQETSLMMAAFEESRYRSIGIDEYKWRSVKGTPAHPVRPMHQELNDRSARGETFRFSNPPVDDPSGSRHNPGQNYGPCRCKAVPIVRF